MRKLGGLTAACGLWLLALPLTASAQPKAKILTDNGAYHRVYLKQGAANLVFGMDARIGVAGIIGRKRPQFLRLHYSDGSSIQYARLMRGGRVDVARRMTSNAKELAKVFAAMGRPQAAQALRALAKSPPQSASPYRGTGVNFGGIWTDPGVGVTLPSGDRLYFRMMGEGRNGVLGHQRMRLTYGFAPVTGEADRHSVVLHGTTHSAAQQRNNARKLNQALDYLEARLVGAAQP